ncbi:MAG: hypothetical protein JSW47_01055 [Phycisphaerales bacterium]|nr:MAG: hypothetical protein JSW47_01055 [Phycisphaerales bacterium]
MKRRNKIIVTIVLLVAGVLYLDVLVPIYKRCLISDNCRLCGVQKNETTVHLWAFRIQRKVVGPTRTAQTDLYDKYIAEPHQHQWAGGGFGMYTRRIYGGGIHTDGFHNGEYSISQYRLSRELLPAMEMFNDESVEFRREVYRDLIDCKGSKDYARVRQLLNDVRAAPEDARKLYEVYRLEQLDADERQ